MCYNHFGDGMNNIKLETLSLCRYDENKYGSVIESFKNESKSKFIHNIDERLDGSKNCNTFTFQSAYIILKEDNPVGYIYLSSVFKDEVYLELSILKEYRGMGIGKIVTNEVCDFLFNNYNIRVVKLDIDPSNKNSILTAKACDFEFDEDDYESKNFSGHMVFFKESSCYESKLRRKL